MLEVRGLYAGYYRDLPILRGVSLKASARQITAVLGANGVGKSTLLKTIFGLIRPEQGRSPWRAALWWGCRPTG